MTTTFLHRQRRFARLVVMAAALLSALPPAHAASSAPTKAPPGARTHDGLYVHAGLSGGRTWLWYDAPMNTGLPHHGRATGSAFGIELAVGGTPYPGLVLSGMLFGHSQGDMSFDHPMVSTGWDKSSTALAGLGALARFYPLPSVGFHVEAIVAGVSHRTTHELKVYQNQLTCPVLWPNCWSGYVRTIEEQERSSGYELGIGAGHELWVANDWSVGIDGRMLLAHTWADTRSYWFAMPTLTIGVTYH